jgi:hypothetical protein
MPTSLEFSTGVGQTLDEAQRVADISDVPASWLLPVRDISPVTCADVEWEVDVAAIRQAVHAEEKMFLTSPNRCLLAMGGIIWDMRLYGCWDAGKQGSTIALFVCARHRFREPPSWHTLSLHLQPGMCGSGCSKQLHYTH